MRRPLIACKRSSDYSQIDGTGLVAVRVKATIGSISLAMRLTAAILLIGALQVNARGVAQKISITGANLPLSAVFHAIEDQTGYGVLMEKSTLEAAKPVSISLTNGTIDDVMKVCFSFQPWKLTYTISGKTIAISKVREAIANLPPSNAPEIEGIVRNDEGTPLAGATVEVKGLNKRGQTNERGEFTLKNVPNGKYNVEISFVGYENFVTEIKVEDNVFRLIAELKRSSNILDQTQVIAYGTTTQRFSTGNVTTVKGEDIQKQPVNNPLLALEGRVPGLFITQANGLPGSGITVQIQGQNSIANGNDPFYVIDGVPYVSQLLPTSLGGNVLGLSGKNNGNPGNPLSYINPMDIESIEVLKDADATAIYGSRAANGAILITTKKGKSGPTKVDINIQNGWGQVTRKLSLLNTQQYLQMRHEAIANDNLSIKATDYDINGFWDTTRYTDWQKALIGRTANYTDISSSASGGTSNIQYLVGGTFHRETTVFPGDLYDQKGSLHFNLNNVSLNRKFHIQLSANYLVDNNHLQASDLTVNATQFAPDAPSLYNSDGTLNWQPNATGISTWINPLRYQYRKYNISVRNLVSNLVLGYQILPGLEIKSNLGYTDLQLNELQTSPLIAVQPERRPSSSNNAGYTYNSIRSWLIEPQVIYKKLIGKGKLETLVGSTIQQNNSKGQVIYGIGYNNDQVLEDIGSAATVVVTSSTQSVYKYNALFGKVNYIWDDKYIVDFTARRDGSSRFGPANRFHNFGAAGIGWIFTQEKFGGKNISWLSFGKLRGSYGSTGSDQIGDYQFLSLYTPVSLDVAYQNANALGVNGLTNPYLQWEETKKLQLGLDLGFFKDRILLTTNYILNRSSNQLLAYVLPIITGFSSITKNFPATLQNKAWEFMLNAKAIKSKNFTWSVNVNLTIPRNKLIVFADLANSSYSSSFIIGQPVSILHEFHFLGVDPATGKYQFADSHGGATFSPSFSTDRTAIINLDPKFYGGFLNSIDYKGFRVDILLQFVKQVAANTLFGNTRTPGTFGYNQPISVLSRWKKPGDVAFIQRYNSNSSLSQQFQYAQSSDASFSDASYVRLKNISLSWEVPTNWRKQAHIQNARVYFQAQNLLTLTSYKGMDPENKSTTSLPPLRVLTAGIQVIL